MPHPTCAYGGFQILRFQNLLLIHFIIKKIDFNSSVHQTLATMIENCLLNFVLPPSS